MAAVEKDYTALGPNSEVSMSSNAGTRKQVCRYLVVACAFAVCLALAGCSGGSSSTPVAGGTCQMNSDCAQGLTCSFGRCQVPCKEARDCANGGQCVKDASGINTCLSSAAETCSYNSQCTLPLVCAVDLKCRNQCLADRDCATSTQKCVLPDGVCAEPSAITNGTLIVGGSGGSTGGSGGSTGIGGTAGQQCTSPNCIACITQNCNSEAMTVFGGGYMNYQFNGGQCPNLMACACTTSGSGSMDVCVQQSGSACATAFAALTSCLDAASCGTACTGNGNGGSGGSGGTGSPLAVSANSLDFGTVVVGSTQEKCVAVTGPNASTTISPQLWSSGMAQTGPAFGTLPPTCSTSSSCEVCVVFSPQDLDPVSGYLDIVPGLSVSLSGTGGMGSTPILSGNTLDFGSVEVGAGSMPKCVNLVGSNASASVSQEISNDTGCALGACAFMTYQAPTCRTSNSCQVCVLFSPQYAGPATGTLTVAPGLVVSLSGTATVPGTFTVTPSAIPATLLVGQSASVSVTVATTSGVASMSCNSSGLELTADLAKTTCTRTMAANTSCVYAYTFRATTPGSKYDSIYCNANGTSKSVDIVITVTTSTTPSPDASVADTAVSPL